MTSPKPKAACYWACGCGGCDVALLDTAHQVLELAEHVDFVFWPIALDFKEKDVVALDDGAIDICFFNGAIRNDENLHMARLLRRKSKLLVALGICAQTGGVHSLLNTSDAEAVQRTVYEEVPGTDNPAGLRPRTSTPAPEGELRLPALFDRVTPLADAVEVDFTIPGCPPAPERLSEVLHAYVSGSLPAAGAVLCASDRALCETCPREQRGDRVDAFRRIDRATWDPTVCFLDQGIVCLGPVTRGGCGEACVRHNMPCQGCYGPTPETIDPGGAMVGALAARLAPADAETIDVAASSLDDPLGTLYRYTLGVSLLDKRGRR